MGVVNPNVNPNVNPKWREAVRIEIARRNITKNAVIDLAGLKSREYASAVMNGRTVSNTYASEISRVLGITEPYLIDAGIS